MYRSSEDDKKFEEILRENNEQINRILKDVSVAKYMMDRSSIVAVTDRQGTILYVNEKFCEVSKYSFTELWGQDHRILNSGYHPKSFFKEMWATIGRGEIWQGEIKNRAKDGTYYWVDTTIVPFLDNNGKPFQYVSIRNEITERKVVEEELRKSEEKFRLITENSTDLIATIDKEGQFLYVSPSFKTMLNFEIDAFKRTHILDWVKEEYKSRVVESLHKTLTKYESSSQIELQLRKKDGSYIYVEAKISPVITQSDRIDKLVLVMRDITERKKTEAVIHRLAYQDPLTDLPNRRYFMEHFQRELAKAKRDSKQLAVMYIDVDRFKNINDSHGHEKGDLVLIETAKRIKENIGKNNLAARLGGDEFSVLLTNISGKEEVEKVARNIQHRFQSLLEFQGSRQYFSCSIGISIFPTDGKEADELLRRADYALYVVKQQGRNGYLFFDCEMEKVLLERLSLEQDLRKAIENEEFYIDYQPKFHLVSGEIIGMEALVRWNHPELGRVSPGKFIPIAEETGLIIPIGEWVLKKSCEQVVKWQKETNIPLKLAVNLSASQFYQHNLVDVIKNTLNETTLKPQLLELEITESVFTNIERSISIMREIRQLGVRTSIDDFGTGYSSLSYIKELPIDTLKIDASFIQDIHLNKESQAIVRAIMSIASTLKLVVIAEGIEKEDQMKVLIEDGCFKGQGFLFSKPLSASSFEHLLKKKRNVFSE